MEPFIQYFWHKTNAVCVCVIFWGGEGGALLVPDTSSTDQSKICTTVQLMQINS